jgi:hypothetical protein
MSRLFCETWEPAASFDFTSQRRHRFKYRFGISPALPFHFWQKSEKWGT